MFAAAWAFWKHFINAVSYPIFAQSFANCWRIATLTGDCWTFDYAR